MSPSHGKLKGRLSKSQQRGRTRGDRLRYHQIGNMVKYLDKGELPEGKEEARRIRRRLTRSMLVDEILYKRGFVTPFFWCISPQKAQYVLTEIHEGIRRKFEGEHPSQKGCKIGYSWPNALRDGREFTKRCIKCQTYPPISHAPSKELTSMIAPWPFT